MSDFRLRMRIWTIIAPGAWQALECLVARSSLEALRRPMEIINLWSCWGILPPTQPKFSTFDFNAIYFLDTLQRALRRLELRKAKAPRDTIFLYRQPPRNQALNVAKQVTDLLFRCIERNVANEHRPNILPSWLNPALLFRFTTLWPDVQEYKSRREGSHHREARKHSWSSRSARRGRSGWRSRKASWPCACIWDWDKAWHGRAAPTTSCHHHQWQTAWQTTRHSWHRKASWRWRQPRCQARKRYRRWAIHHLAKGSGLLIDDSRA
mmetsp:Transcript_21166/g.39788  ORF Transcript_21166/g.39788 Transcript_21166/m.39788 type:complete len:266 (-) Transcript_21166:47-844(-)